MKVLRRMTWAVLASLTAVSIVSLTFPASATEMRAGALVPLLAGPDGPESYVAPELSIVPQAVPAKFVVTYVGFPAAAKTAFQRAVNIWASLISSPVPITVRATYTPLAAGVLGSAGPGVVVRDFSGAPQKGTWYVEALANKRAGKQFAAASPDILANFSSAFPNWYFGAGTAPAGKYDFTSVVLHELGHGLGFLGFGRVSGGVGAIKAAGFPSIYDRYVENTAGTPILQFADPSKALAGQFQSNGLWLYSPTVRAANRNLRAKLFAPKTFLPGSSYSHLDEATYKQGNPNSLMTPALNMAETIHSPGPITLAIFKTVGW